MNNDESAQNPRVHNLSALCKVILNVRETKDRRNSGARRRRLVTATGLLEGAHGSDRGFSGVSSGAAGLRFTLSS